MARILENGTERVYPVKRWLGINEAEEGEATLRAGEAAVMRNFRVTSGGALRKRAGSRNVAGLAASYDIAAAEGMAYTIVDGGRRTFTLWPRLSIGEGGMLAPEGEPVTADTGTAEDYTGWYAAYAGTRREENLFGRLAGLTYTPRTEMSPVSRGYAGGEWRGGTTLYAWICLYDSVKYVDGAWETQGGRVVRLVDMSRTQRAWTILETFRTPAVIFASAAPAEAEFRAKYAKGALFASVLLAEGEENPAANPCWRAEVTVWPTLEASYSWRFDTVRAVPGADADPAVKSLWSGFVGGREVIAAAAGGKLWELRLENGAWTRATCGAVETTGSVFMFGFGEKLYVLNGREYKVWDGNVMADVAGYRPIVTKETVPEGGGVTAEAVNKLTGARRAWFSPDGTAKTFRLPEGNVQSIDWVKDLATGQVLSGYTASAEAGTVTFTAAPARGVDTLEIAWTVPTNDRARVLGMRFAELFNGVTDTRVFLYGDGTNTALYSGLDNNGTPRADYFPDLNECAVGDANTPITAMIRHYARLLCFKQDSTWAIKYDTVTLGDGTVTAGFCVLPVNRDVGSCAWGEARLVENRPRTLDGRSVIEWRTASGGSLTDDQRNAERISQRVDATIRRFDLTRARTFYDKVSHEYYVIGEEGVALVHNVEADAWYVYTGFGATCMLSYQDEVYYGTSDGYLRHFSEDYLSDNGEVIDAYWESGAMDFSQDFRRKYAAMIWIGIKPEENGYLEVTAQTDRKSGFAAFPVDAEEAGAVPTMARLKLKAKKFTFYKLIFRNRTADTAATVVSADIRVRGTSVVT